tara:strand:- start:609 stop:1520 length:912 start_codon:yes stop_codon:yes gene_type:complete
MANTSFTGPVRSKEGFKIYNITDSTGVDADRTLHDLGIKDTRRYYLEEYFNHLPGINGDLASTTEATNTPVNRSFEILGTNHTSALATYSSTVAGMTITTAGADQDRMIVAPHLDTKQGAWANTKWGTENQVHWECGIRTSSAIDNQKIWAGLKLTNDQLPQTDANQAYFYFATDATNGQALSTYTPLYFIHSVAGTDYLTNTGITVAASTNYHLKIKFDSDRKMEIFVNGVQYGVTQTAATTFDGSTSVTGTTQADIDDKTQKSVAMTDDIDLIPYIGIEAGDGAAAALDVQFEAISRLIYE